MIKLFIGGFPLEWTEMEVVQLVAPFADVVTIKLVRDKVTKVCKGYGFIEVVDETHAYNAIDNLNSTPIGDRELSLNIVRDEAPKAAAINHKTKRRPSEDRPKRPRRPKLS